MTTPESRPRVSLILLSYGYARFVGEAIESVLAQTFVDWELVVVDDASPDESVEVVRRFDDPRISLRVNRENLGGAATFNVGLRLCRGELVGSLDADDLLEPQRLERQVAFMDAHPEVDVSATYVTLVDGAGRPSPRPAEDWINQPRALHRLDPWYFADPLCHSSVLLRRERHLAVGGLDPDLRLAPDFEMWARCLARGLRIAVVPERLVRYRVHGGNISSDPDPRRFFLELAYVFCAHLAPLAARHGRGDLVARGLAFFTDSLPPGVTRRLTMHRLLTGLCGHPPGFRRFAAALEATAGDDWRPLVAAVEASAERRRGSADATIVASPTAVPRPPSRSRLGVVDDYFPDLLTPFRIAELNAYLAELDAEVHSTHPDFDVALAAYREAYPALACSVVPFDPERLGACALLYFVFAGNAWRHLPLVERHGLPFVFTLYPGGSFELHDPWSDLRLQQLFRSPWFHRVIVTQHATRDYLLASGLCPADRIELVYGVPLPVACYARDSPPRRLYPRDKATFDVCFVARKYMPQAADKGYPTFVEVAHELATEADDVRFHVVGGATRDDLPVAALGDRIAFHPLRTTPFFPSFYATMDAILSPNRPFLLRPGGFDGFPTASCVEASLGGVAVFASDVLQENERGAWYRPDEEIVIVEPTAADIVPRLLAARRDPDRLYRLAAAGQTRSRELFAPERQLAPRLALLRAALDDARTRVARRGAA